LKSFYRSKSFNIFALELKNSKSTFDIIFDEIGTDFSIEDSKFF